MRLSRNVTIPNELGLHARSAGKIAKLAQEAHDGVFVVKDGEEADAEDDGEEEGDAENMPAIYLPIDPAFVVNFASQGKARFLQVTVEVMTRDPLMPDQVKLHMPVIRNNSARAA